MAQPKRNAAPDAYSPDPRSPATGSGQPGGTVASAEADAACRLAWPGVRDAGDASAGERMVRRASVAGGYLALLAAYAGVASLILR